MAGEIIYKIYPLGMCGAPYENDGILTGRILRVIRWIPYLKKLGVTAVLFNPVFESRKHGYDTADFAKIDCRLGTNEDFALVCDSLHDQGIKVYLDAVFNHTGRSFPPFQDVLKNKEASRYKDWFHIDFTHTDTRDGFSYADWEGHRPLVQLNMDNAAVRRFLIERADQWIAEFGIDGLRLDVAHMLDRRFMRELCAHIRSYAPDFFFLGEMTGGWYGELLSDGLMDSVTNYELRGALIHAFSNNDLHSIADTAQRQCSELTHYRNLLSFADNHDVNRFASMIKDPENLYPAYALLYALPGIPCIYYGSEWAAAGKRSAFSDRKLRPEFKQPHPNGLTEQIAVLSQIRTSYRIFADGDFRLLYCSGEQMVFRRRNHKGQLTFALNISRKAAHIETDTEVQQGIDLIDHQIRRFDGTLDLPAHSAYFWYTDWI